MKIRPVGAELFDTEEQTEGGQTDMTKVIVAFRYPANAPKRITKPEGHFKQILYTTIKKH
jgi:hypothetical protein